MYTKTMKLNSKMCDYNIMISSYASDPDVFGVEVELEGKNIWHATDEIYKYWSKHNDGSLRKLAPGDEAVEYVFAHPMPLLKSIKAIEVLFEFLNKPPAIVYDSYRTSVHVHVNYAQETLRTVYNAMTISTILDELLVSQNGQHRVGNNFCLRTKDALGQILSVISSTEMKGNFFNIAANHRYSSINFASLVKFGSIEYRSLECTLHEGRLIHWIGTVQAIKESARLFKDPVEIIQQFSIASPEEFLKRALGPFALKYLQVPGYEHMLHEGMRLAQDLAYCSTWKGE